MVLPRASRAARLMQCSSSRTLPGHAWDSSRAMAAGSIESSVAPVEPVSAGNEVHEDSANEPAAWEAVLAEPHDVGLGQVDQQAPLVAAEGHFHLRELDEHLRIEGRRLVGHGAKVDHARGRRKRVQACGLVG